MSDDRDPPEPCAFDQVLHAARAARERFADLPLTGIDEFDSLTADISDRLADLIEAMRPPDPDLELESLTLAF